MVGRANRQERLHAAEIRRVKRTGRDSMTVSSHCANIHGYQSHGGTYGVQGGRWESEVTRPDSSTGIYDRRGEPSLGGEIDHDMHFS